MKTYRDSFKSFTTIEAWGGPYDHLESTTSWLNQVSGGLNPSWRENIKSHTQAATDLYGYSKRVNASEFFASGRYSIGGGSVTIYGKYPMGSIAGLDPSMDKADTQAKISVCRQIVNRQRSLQGGVVMGEAAKTARMIKRPGQSLIRGFKDYFRTAEKRVRRSLRPSNGGSRASRSAAALEAVRGTYLESVFGWAPLINDLDDAMKLAADISNRSYAPSQVIVNGKGTHRVSPSPENVVLSYVSSSCPWLWIEGFVTQAAFAEVRYQASVSVSPMNKLSFRRLGVSLQDFVPTVWELIPYSFLVDYFTNVGDVIDALCIRSADINWVVRYSELNKTCTTEGRKVFFPSQPGNWSVTGFSPGKTVLVERTVTRGPFFGSLVPRFRFELPEAADRKWYNIAALLPWGRAISKLLR